MRKSYDIYLSRGLPELIGDSMLYGHSTLLNLINFLKVIVTLQPQFPDECYSFMDVVPVYWVLPQIHRHFPAEKSCSFFSVRMLREWIQGLGALSLLSWYMPMLHDVVCGMIYFQKIPTETAPSLTKRPQIPWNEVRYFWSLLFDSLWTIDFKLLMGKDEVRWRPVVIRLLHDNVKLLSLTVYGILRFHVLEILHSRDTISSLRSIVGSFSRSYLVSRFHSNPICSTGWS